MRKEIDRNYRENKSNKKMETNKYERTKDKKTNRKGIHRKTKE